MPRVEDPKPARNHCQSQSRECVEEFAHRCSPVRSRSRVVLCLEPRSGVVLVGRRPTEDVYHRNLRRGDLPCEGVRSGCVLPPGPASPSDSTALTAPLGVQTFAGTLTTMGSSVTTFRVGRTGEVSVVIKSVGPPPGIVVGLRPAGVCETRPAESEREDVVRQALRPKALNQAKPVVVDPQPGRGPVVTGKDQRLGHCRRFAVKGPSRLAGTVANNAPHQPLRGALRDNEIAVRHARGKNLGIGHAEIVLFPGVVGRSKTTTKRPIGLPRSCPGCVSFARRSGSRVKVSGRTGHRATAWWSR